MYVPQGFSGRVKEKSFGHHSCSQCFSPHCSATENKTKAHPSPPTLSISSHPLQHHCHITNCSLYPCSHTHTPSVLIPLPLPPSSHTNTKSFVHIHLAKYIYSALTVIRSLARTVVGTTHVLLKQTKS